MELGKRIRQLRFKAGLTQEQLADKLGLGAQAVSKWENAAAMPDITALPLLAEIFGVSIDDLFDLSSEQRLNRIENRLDTEEDLPQDVFMEYEEFLKSQLNTEEYKKRATSLIAFLYWHRMESFARKASRYAREAVQAAPNEKDCQWILQKAEGHAVWDWNFANHSKGIEFYQELVKKNPEARLPYLYLLDNLLADHRAEEAEALLPRFAALPDVNPVHVEVYRAHIALARFDEPGADRIIEDLGRKYPDDFVYLFEAAQYYAAKCDYDKAIALYERSFALEPRRPRFQDELMAIADIWEIRGDYKKAAETCDRIIDLLENEWGLTEEVELLVAKRRKARLLEKV
ncbi:MAG: helix-turn-helix domain-containing protein [Clostridia bacterium]|nr:helix-turn-helix domain-containing protein [Clostridia bacterium]